MVRYLQGFYLQKNPYFGRQKQKKGSNEMLTRRKIGKYIILVLFSRNIMVNL